MKESEKHLLIEWNHTQTDYPQQACIHHLFEAQVEKIPDAVALIFNNQHLTYRDLNSRANQLAHYLQTLGVGAGTLVGICIERSLEMIIGLLGILKASGAYVPLDPTYPQERLAYILNDSQVRVLLTQEKLVTNLPEHIVRAVCLDTDWREISAQSEDNLLSDSQADNLAYVIYTSGSTGQPKGTLVNHSNVVRLFEATNSWYHFNEDDVWTLFHSYAFDFSVWEIWGALLYGGRLVVVPYLVTRSPESFLELLCQGEKQLTAYVVPHYNSRYTHNKLRTFLQQRIPNYMVPSAFVMLESLPLTVNGKVDRHKLPAPSREHPQMEQAYIAPQTDLERLLAGVLSELLKIDRVGIDDNFFDLGGTSISILQVAVRVKQELGIELPTVKLFQYSTIGSLAKYLHSNQNSQPSHDKLQNRAQRQQAAQARRRNQQQGV